MYQFDPCYGHILSTLLKVDAPQAPEGFSTFWQGCFEQIERFNPLPKIKPIGRRIGNFDLYDLKFHSTDNIIIQGWVLMPISQSVKKVMIVGHGYGGCDEPNGNVPILDCAYLYLCYRGISRSRIQGIPEDPNYHVLYNIHDRDQYIMRGCVEDTWMAVSAAEALFPMAKDHIGFMGISLSGGLGALALPWDKRIKKAHLQVPTFGHQPLRLQLPSLGSANAIQKFYAQHPHSLLETLAYYDAAIAAKFIQIPVHIAAALSDPYVAPPGQFAIYNSITSERTLFVLEKGHSQYPNDEKEQAELMINLTDFFSTL